MRGAVLELLFGAEILASLLDTRRVFAVLDGPILKRHFSLAWHWSHCPVDYLTGAGRCVKRSLLYRRWQPFTVFEQENTPLWVSTVGLFHWGRCLQARLGLPQAFPGALGQFYSLSGV